MFFNTGFGEMICMHCGKFILNRQYDDLLKEWARAPAAMILTYLSWNIPDLALEDF